MRKDIMKQLQKHIKKEIRLNKSELARRLDCDVRTITKYLQTSTEIERKPRKKDYVTTNNTKKHERIRAELESKK